MPRLWRRSDAIPGPPPTAAPPPPTAPTCGRPPHELEVPSNHAAQIHRLVDDLISGRPHDTTLASTRSTMELVTALYASSIDGRTVRRGELAPTDPYYHRLDGGLAAEAITARLATSRRPSDLSRLVSSPLTVERPRP